MTDCHHHWIIQTPSGPLVHGHCKLCLAERDFKAAFNDKDYMRMTALAPREIYGGIADPRKYQHTKPKFYDEEG